MRLHVHHDERASYILTLPLRIPLHRFLTLPVDGFGQPADIQTNERGGRLNCQGGKIIPVLSIIIK